MSFALRLFAQPLSVTPPGHSGYMTVLDLDSPHRRLRLVSTNGSAPIRDTRYRTHAPLYGQARDLYRQVLQASLQNGTAIDTNALRVVLATKQATTAGPARAFSAATIWQLMFVDIVAWCRTRHLDVPTGCARALTSVIDYLHAHDLLHDLSDDALALYDAIDECTGGWAADESAPASASPAKARRSLPSHRGPKRT